MAQLAQAYVHLRPYRVTRGLLDELGDYTEQTAIEAIKRIYGGNVTVEIKIEEGSLKAWVTVLGVLYVGADIAHKTYGTIADYKGFKDSIVELCKDAREFGVDVCGAVTAKSGASESQIFRTEKRRKTPGRLARLIEHLEQVDQLQGKLSKGELARQMEMVRRELAVIERDLTPEESDVLHRYLQFENIPPLRQVPGNAPRLRMPKAAIRVSETEDKLLPWGQSLPWNSDTPPPEETSKRDRLVYRKRTFVAAVIDEEVEIEIKKNEIKKEEPPTQTVTH
jgi:hypothetical protein